MEFEPVRADLFPTPVYAVMLPDAAAMNAGLLASIEVERAQDEKGLEVSNYVHLGGWHSRTTLHREPDFAGIANAVRQLARHVSQDLNYAPERRLDIDAMWAIVNAPGASNQAHIHPGSLWSGVYYVRARGKAGDIAFIDPRTANLMRQPRYEKRPEICQTEIRHAPQPGCLLLFPSWLYHLVHPNLSDEDRVILSFNLSQY